MPRTRPTRRARHRQRLAALHAKPGIQRVLAAAGLTTALCGDNRARRVRRYRPLPSRQQSNPVSRVKLQRPGQAPQRMKVRVPAGTTFQVRDSAHAKPGAVGQRLLRQPRRQPVLAKQLRKGAPPFRLRHLLHGLPPGKPQAPSAHDLSCSMTALPACRCPEVAPAGDPTRRAGRALTRRVPASGSVQTHPESDGERRLSPYGSPRAMCLHAQRSAPNGGSARVLLELLDHSV